MGYNHREFMEAVAGDFGQGFLHSIGQYDANIRAFLTRGQRERDILIQEAMESEEYALAAVYALAARWIQETFEIRKEELRDAVGTLHEKWDCQSIADLDMEEMLDDLRDVIREFDD